MCGIFGVVRTGGLTVADRWLLRDMADGLAHRGPDGEGFHVAERVGIGMTRLAIIDLEGGWQPLYNEDRSLALVLNGEIYNYVELRRELEGRGHRLGTRGDAETVLHLYEDYGAECVQHLRGQFAFALFDERRQTLLLARDRMGEKPLFVAERGDDLVFCSEMSGLVGSGAVPFDLNPDAVRMYYHWNFVPEPTAAVRGVRKLPSGTTLTIDLRSGRREEHVYWRLEDAPPLDDEPIERLRGEIDTIGRIIVRADVPVGIGLSGGIDSSAIAVLAQKHSNQPVTAFTIGYEGVSWQDERGLAREFADHVGLPLHELRLDLDRVVREFPEMCVRRNDPISDLSGMGFYALNQLCRDHGVPVLLTGLGGDELFWGYGWLRDAVTANRRKRRLLAGEAGLLDYLRVRRPPLSLAGGADWVEDLGGLLGGLRQWRRDRRTEAERLVFYDERPEFRGGERGLHSVAGPALADSTLSPAWPFVGAGAWTDLETSITCLVCETFLGSNGLVMGDRLSMASSVECRVPLVDYRLAETVVGLRKVHSDLPLGHKGWLKQVLSELVPSFVLNRRKRGFTPPWRQWTPALMRRYGADMVRGVLVERGMLRREAMERFRKGFDALGRPMPMAYPTLVLEQWARGMVDLENAAVARRSRSRGEPRLVRSGPGPADA